MDCCLIKLQSLDPSTNRKNLNFKFFYSIVDSVYYIVVYSLFY